MPNTFFQFKQFTIQQDKTAMKVCTDACLLGAWAAGKMDTIPVKTILDIGCGTGLLSLMLAQKIHADIDAIEIEPAAAKQAMENISASPWQKNITVKQISLQEYSAEKKYDLIICNPPFYEQDLKSGDENKNAAKHDTTLRLAELLSFAGSYLNPAGSFIILLPYQRMEYCETQAAKNGLYVQERLLIKQSPRHNYFRSIILFSNVQIETAVTGELVIHDDNRNYTDDFISLLKDYYLKL